MTQLTEPIKHLLTIPIAETFSSIQGEGNNTGRLMFFIRTAGCNVGRIPTTQVPNIAPVLPTGKAAWQCHAYDNRSFWCDTDFNAKEHLTPEQLHNRLTNEPYISLTGGEPLVHQRRLLDSGFFEMFSHVRIHLETSGTVMIDPSIRSRLHWLVVAPKAGVLDDMLLQADEIRILVDEQFDPDKLPEVVKRRKIGVWLSPINGVADINQPNTQKAIKLLKTYFPTWRISTQVHKVWGVE